MRTFLVAALFFGAALPAAAGCITTPAGRTICRDAAGQIIAAPVGSVSAAPPAGAVVASPGVAVAPVTGVSGAVVAPHAAIGVPAYTSGVEAVHGPNGGAAYNPRTGNAAVSEKNAYGVTTTQTTRGGEAKTKNGMGVAHGPGGKTCVKGRGEGKCN